MNGRTDGIIVTIDYQRPNVVEVTVDDEVVDSLPYTEDDTSQLSLSDSTGTNRWIYNSNTIQFVLKGETIVHLEVLNTLRLTYTLDMDDDKFFDDDGDTKFIDRLAAVLGIKPHRIRIVDVSPGSTIITTQIKSDQALRSNYNDDINELAQLKELAERLAIEDAYDFAGPLLSLNSGLEKFDSLIAGDEDETLILVEHDEDDDESTVIEDEEELLFVGLLEGGSYDLFYEDWVASVVIAVVVVLLMGFGAILYWTTSRRNNVLVPSIVPGSPVDTKGSQRVPVECLSVPQ